MRRKTIRRRECATIVMGDGEGKVTIIIDGGVVKQYVGIGWIILRKATARDKQKYPRLVD